MPKKKYFEKFYLLIVTCLVRGRAILRSVLYRDFAKSCTTFDYYLHYYYYSHRDKPPRVRFGGMPA